MNNIPPLLQFSDFMARHSDMVAAACGEPLTKDQIEAARNSYVYDWQDKRVLESSLFAQIMAGAKNAKVGTMLRIRFPPDYKGE